MPNPLDELLVESQSVNDLAYHGTSKSAAESIVSNGFALREGEDAFLGEGVYFFDNQRSMAIWWARDYREYKPWAVIRATVRLGRCFNIHEDSHRAALLILIERLQQTDPDVSDAAAINALALLTPIDSVTGEFRREKANPYRPKSRFIVGHRSIICIRNLASILHTKVDCTGS